MKFGVEDLLLVQDYIQSNSDKPIYLVFRNLKYKGKKERTRAENIVYMYLKLNKGKLGIRD